jgi:acetyl-CoA carboxylase biotin carboxyl carrier protein
MARKTQTPPKATRRRPASAVRAPAAPAAATPVIDPALLRTIAELVAQSDLTEFEVEKGDLRIRAARTPAALTPTTVTIAAPPAAHAYAPPAAAAAAPKLAPPAPAEETYADHPGAVKSPMVGTAYLRPNPDAKAFVEIGARGFGRRQAPSHRGDEDLQRHRRAEVGRRHSHHRRRRTAGRIWRASPRDRIGS